MQSAQYIWSFKFDYLVLERQLDIRSRKDFFLPLSTFSNCLQFFVSNWWPVTLRSSILFFPWLSYLFRHGLLSVMPLTYSGVTSLAFLGDEISELFLFSVSYNLSIQSSTMFFQLYSWHTTNSTSRLFGNSPSLDENITEHTSRNAFNNYFSCVYFCPLDRIPCFVSERWFTG